MADARDATTVAGLPRARSPHDAVRDALAHPADWTNPTPRDRYDLVVLGGGTGGLVAAAGAAGLGARVALVERHLLGGDCLNVGCVPSKGLLAAGRLWEAARAAGASGGPRVADDGGDAAVALERMRAARAAIAPNDSARRFAELGVHVFLGDGAFVAPDAIAVGGATLRFRRAVLATGGRPAAPPIAGLAEVGFLTNESVFDLERPPARLVVVGGGPIGCELAQAFARLGSDVALVQRGARLLAKEDGDAAAVVEAALREDGVRLELGVALERAAREPDGVALHGARGREAVRVAGDAILVAAGRRPNVEGIGLERAGIAHTERGVTVDARLRTTNRRVFAVGDVNGTQQFTHLADAQARLALQNAFFLGRKRHDALVVPRVTYTSPELATVGLTRAEARERGVATDEVTVGFAHVDRAIVEHETRGFARVLLARGSDRIVGVTIVGEHAGEIVGEASVAMTNGLGLGALGAAIHPYPTRAEVLRKAADQHRRTRLTPRVRRLFDLWFRVFRRLG
jgi:pyruvate/2-oxoglutarate dehydrogenase complex dihydrolipoamide dehydrogenase (E3) component